MNISIDFDDTYTRDPELWESFIERAQARGHEVYCVTARAPSKINRDEVYDSIGKLVGRDNCIFTDSKAKARACAEQGVRIDVWIDDLPSNVDNDKRLFADFKSTNFPY